LNQQKDISIQTSIIIEEQKEISSDFKEFLKSSWGYIDNMKDQVLTGLGEQKIDNLTNMGLIKGRLVVIYACLGTVILTLISLFFRGT
jgi:hypothetical protein